MSFVEFTKKTLMSYFIIVTGVTVAIAVLGMNYDPDNKFGYEAYFSPLVIGAVATLPNYVFYSKNELPIKQMLFRKILHFIVLVSMMLALGLVMGILTNVEITIMFVLSVLAVYIFKTIIDLFLDSNTAIKINEGLMRLKE